LEKDEFESNDEYIALLRFLCLIQIKKKFIVYKNLINSNYFKIIRLLENLLKKAIELNDTELCFCIINNVQILEEYQAVDCLKYFLK
jgi:hypothetical protein